MKAQEFQLKVVEDLAEIKQEIKHIKKNMPLCEKEKHNEKLRNLERLIYLVLASYIPLIIGIYFII